MKHAINVIRTRQDGAHVDMYTSTFLVSVPINTSVSSGETYMQLIRAAIAGFLKTKAGQEALGDTCEDFNWGDVDTYIPDEFFSQYGISRPTLGETFECAGICTVMVNQDELLFGDAPGSTMCESSC